MKRMKKKVVAMVTLAMFVMTLLPMAAFAAPGAADPQASKFITAKENVSVNVGDDVDTVFKVVDKDGVAANDLTQVLVWAEENGNISSAATFTGNNTVAASNNTKIFKVNNLGAVANGTELKVNFSRPGTYTLKAITYTGGTIGAGDTVKDVITDALQGVSYLGTVSGFSTVTVAAESQSVDSMSLVDNGASAVTLNNKATEELDPVVVNTIDAGEFTLTALDDKGRTIEGKDITVKTNSANLVVTGDTKTNGVGKITLKYQAKVAGKYTITVSADSYKAYLTVDVTEATGAPDNITTTVEDGVVNQTKATNDTATFAKAVQFEITDKNDVVLSGDNAINQEAIYTGTNIEKYAEVVEQPKNDLDASDIRVAYDAAEEVYTLKLATDKDLAEGKYTVKVGLLSKAVAEATFTVAAEGDPTELIIDGPDVVKAGEKYEASLYYVDENGLKIDASGNQLLAGFFETASVDTSKGKDFVVASDNDIHFYAKSGEAYYGTKVTVYVVDSENGYTVTKDITVVDPSVADKYTVQFDNIEGPINKDNTVKVSVLDADGEIVDLDNAKGKAYVAKVSDSEANVNLVANDFTVNNGKGEIKVYADKACTADIVVAVKKDGKIYAGNFTYTFGKQDIPADTSVVMTLGSTEMLVNNNIVDMKDAAPFAQDNRTYVPFRALGEALGAQVEYDKDAKTVTYELGSTKIVMTLDSKTYTVNGAEKTMDVAPFAKNERTYVPVRFVGEGLGFEVTGLTNANGQYVAVAFTK